MNRKSLQAARPPWLSIRANLCHDPRGSTGLQLCHRSPLDLIPILSQLQWEIHWHSRPARSKFVVRSSMVPARESYPLHAPDDAKRQSLLCPVRAAKHQKHPARPTTPRWRPLSSRCPESMRRRNPPAPRSSVPPKIGRPLSPKTLPPLKCRDATPSDCRSSGPFHGLRPTE